jgi:NADPH:quinone reductase-like Zn-dependent oxidoreductase
MKAIIHARYGSPEVLQMAEVPRPTPKDNEVLIKVHATTVNRTDCGFRSAEYFISRFFSGLFRPKNQILGNEFAGEIEAVGMNVKSFHPGDKVFGYNDITFGAYAEYMVMAESGPIAILPVGLTFEEAAPITEGGHYALCDIRAAKVGKGQKVLINGATGAIGSAAVQLCHYFGAEVTAVCATPHLELVISLGAMEVIDYKNQDFTKLNKTFDFVFDAVGKSTFGKCRSLLKKGGIYISTELGPGGQNPFLALITPLLGGKKLLFPIPTINKHDVLFLKELVEAGQFKPVIDRKYLLDQIIEATRYVETGQKTGNVVIQVVQS